jgi:predicted DNA-binding protein YlxM (UPF0122 family)
MSKTIFIPPTKSTVGRPPSLECAERDVKILKAYEKTNTVPEIAKAFGISERQIYNRLKKSAKDWDKTMERHNKNVFIPKVAQSKLDQMVKPIRKRGRPQKIGRALGEDSSEREFQAQRAVNTSALQM